MPNGNNGILEQLLEQNPLMKSGLKKIQKNQDQQIDEAMQQGVPAEQILQQLIKKAPTAFNQGSLQYNQQGQPQSFTMPGWFADLFTPGGARGMQELGVAKELSQIQQKQPLSPERQIQTLTRTQNMLKELGIKAKVDVTATGVPSLSTQPELGLAELPPDQQIQAVSLARKVAGVRGADRLIPSIVESLKTGKTIDQVEDELRLSGQSTEFTGALRSAAQQIMVGQTATEKQGTFDDLDDLSRDPEQQREYLKRMAIKNASTTQQQNVMGQERTIDLLSEVKGDLEALEREGFPTGFWSGNIENLMGKVGQVRNPKHRELATKISVAVMQYRRDMTGVQFGMKEHAEYKFVFPNINKINRFNMSAIKGLTDTFKGNINKFYAQSMGHKNYKEIFGKSQQQLPPGYSPDEWEIVQ